MYLFKPSIEQSNISGADVPFPARIDYWIKKRVHVKRKPDWIFIKIHGHGASAEKADRGIFLGRDFDRMFSYLEEK